MAIERTTCANCAVTYAPTLTIGACPVCGAGAEGHVGVVELDADQRTLAIVAVAMIANLLLLAWLAVLYLTG